MDNIGTDNAKGFSVQVMQAGKVCVSPSLPFGGDDASLLRGSGIFTPKAKRLWLPVCSFLVTTPKGRIIVDTGWDRSMSPHGVIDRKAQIRSLDSWLLYKVNQGVVAAGMTVPEQLGRQGLSPEDIDYVVVTHLDCDHTNGLRGLAAAKHIMVAAQEMQYATAFPNNLVRFRKKWWEGLDIDLYTWNDINGPARHSYDLFGDGSVQFINIPGHTDGQIAVKVTNSDGKFVLLFGDGGYSSKSWEEMITSGISTDKSAQKHSLQWIRDQSLNPDCIKSMACHDPDNKPQVITF